MTPVMVLSDGYLANGSEPWKLPDLKDISIEKVQRKIDEKNSSPFMPYLRDEATLARPWAVPGMEGLQHRIGGLEKEAVTGNVNYGGENHENMSIIRKEKIERVGNDIPLLEVVGDKASDTLVIGWGSTFGTIKQAVKELGSEGHGVAHVQLRHLNPLPKKLGRDHWPL